jgi:DNA-binding SARP family transcriptional activator
VDFRVLGPLEIIGCDRKPVRIAQPQVRALLSVLLLHAGRPCRRAMLVEALWGAGRLPREPDGALRMHAYRARKALGRNSGFLATLPDGYRIDPGEQELDLYRFRELTAAGEAALAAGSAQQAREAFAAALGLWRDPPLADLPSAPEIDGEVARLVEQRRTAEIGLADAWLGLGCHTRILPDLRGAVARYPLCEHSWAQLMLASYRSRGRAAALAVYSEVRGVLLGELGVEPGRELQTLLQNVLHEHPDMGLRPLAVQARL